MTESGERARLACWFRRPAETNFLRRGFPENRGAFQEPCARKVREGGTPSPALGTSALPGVFGTPLLFALILLISLHAHAAGPLTAEIKPLALQPRTSAPEVLDVKLRWSGAGVLEGALEIVSADGDDGAPQFRSPELALTSGAKEFRLLLPPSGTSGFGRRELLARFITKSGVLDLGRFDLGTVRDPQRSFTICVPRPGIGANAAPLVVWQSLRLEQFQPAESDYNLPKATTLPVHLDPQEMPVAALGYTPYDIVLLHGQGFAETREKSLAALARWVTAGGSLCVITDTPLPVTHQRFLADLCAADPRAPRLDFDPEGRPILAEESSVLFAKPGLGRLLVTTTAPQTEDEAKAERWLRAVTFLWKFHPGQVSEVIGTGKWHAVTQQENRRERQNQRQMLANLLAPKNVRILPLSAMLLLLGAFVAVIGPLDWWVLGRFRARRLTWLTFPLAALAFTGLTVFLAGRFMGKVNHRSSMTITDLGHDGRVLRETRLELIFPGHAQDVTTEVRHALCAPVDTMGFNQSRPAAHRYDGAFPVNYTLRQSLAQWTPQMNRLTSLEGKDDPSGLPWATLHPAKISEAELSESLGPDASADVFGIDRGGLRVIRSGVVPPDLLVALSQPKGFGWLSVFARFSPNGGSSLEDLGLTGSDEKDFSATIVARRVGGEIHIYRHLYVP